MSYRVISWSLQAAEEVTRYMTREHWETLLLCPTCCHLSYKLPHNIPHLNFYICIFWDNFSRFLSMLSAFCFNTSKDEQRYQFSNGIHIAILQKNVRSEMEETHLFYKFTHHLGPSYSNRGVSYANFEISSLIRNSLPWKSHIHILTLVLLIFFASLAIKVSEKFMCKFFLLYVKNLWMSG